MRHFEKVKEDIRAGRTQLVWKKNEEDDSTSYSIYAEIDDKASFWIWTKENLMSVTDSEVGGSVLHPIREHLLKHLLLEYKEPWRSWDKLKGDVESTKNSCQLAYNDYLLEEARKRDEQ